MVLGASYLSKFILHIGLSENSNNGLVNQQNNKLWRYLLSKVKMYMSIRSNAAHKTIHPASPVSKPNLSSIMIHLRHETTNFIW